MGLVSIHPSTVTVADGRKLRCDHKCHGFKWAKAHNLVVFDFEALAITITRQQKSVSLQGIGERSLQSEFWYSENLLQRNGVDLQTPFFCYCVNCSYL